MPRSVLKGSWYRTIPSRNWIGGLKYCINPSAA